MGLVALLLSKTARPAPLLRAKAASHLGEVGNGSMRVLGKESKEDFHEKLDILRTKISEAKTVTHRL